MLVFLFFQSIPYPFIFLHNDVHRFGTKGGPPVVRLPVFLASVLRLKKKNEKHINAFVLPLRARVRLLFAC